MSESKPSRPASTLPATPKAAPKLIDRKATPAAPPSTVKKSAPRPATSGSKPSGSRPATAKSTGSKPSTTKAPANNAFTKLAAEPERIGEWLYNRAQWVDEIVAILVIVGGLITFFSLVNPTASSTLAGNWAELLRSIFGQTGAMMLSMMIIIGGLLIVLPKINIRVPMSWKRFIFIELAFVTFLSLLHILPNDPEPRALARAGGGGGFIGWALGNTVQKLFGMPFAVFLFGLLTLVFIGIAFGLQRIHLRQSLIWVRGRLDAAAEWLTKERPPRPRKVRPSPKPMAAPVPLPVMAQPLDTPAVAEYTYPPPVLQPITNTATTNARTEYLSSNPVPAVQNPFNTAQPLVTPADPVPTAPLRSKPRSRPATPSAAYAANDAPPAAPEPIAPPPPVIEPRTRRHFVVDDFKEERLILQRSADLPPIDLLHETELDRPTEQEINTNVRIIENTLLEFDIDVEVVDVKVGPTVTLYAVQPFREVVDENGRVTMQRVRVNKIASLDSDLSLALSSKTLRIQPYVPGHSYMGIEVPNRKPSVVALRPVMESQAFGRAFHLKDSDSPTGYIDRPLVVPLGRDVSGSAFVADLATMPHVLIAGTTGSGKSVCITAVALSLIMNSHPDRVKLVMLDPKMVELTRFNGIPHLIGPVETEIDRIIGVLRWATREMERRYKLLETEAARNIDIYNRMMTKQRGEKLPYIVIMIDEIGDLMLTRPEETERSITRLAQMARAVGMHLVVATQRPSVDIITGLIKANFPSRVSFAVASGIDSRVILDAVGAETLMGRGDMLFQASDAAGPQRLQGCFVSDPEVDAVVNYWKKWQADKRSSGEWTNTSTEAGPWDMGITRRESHGKDEPLLEDAITIAVNQGVITPSALQKQLSIDFRHAAKLMDLMQDLGILGVTKLEDGREVTLKVNTDQYRKLMNRNKA